MNHLGEPRIGIAGDDSYAPFEPKVAFSYSSAVSGTYAVPAGDVGVPGFETLPFATELPVPEVAIAETKPRTEETGPAPLSEYQWSGPGRREPHKRAFDLTVSFILLVGVAPLLGVVALAIHLLDGGPILVSDRRIGRFGREISLLSFRTRPRDNARMLVFSRFLKRSGISSLPRLFNVFRGELSLVGARPITEPELPRFGLDVIYYLASRPGLTGAWQAETTRNLNQAARYRFEREYARTRTFRADLKFLLVTLPASLSGKRAV